MGKVKEQAVAYSTRKKVVVSERLPLPKKATLRMLRNLKDNVTYDDIFYHVYVLQKIEVGIRQLDEGKGIPHEEVKKRLKKWLK
jgi:hypothetical protein